MKKYMSVGILLFAFVMVISYKAYKSKTILSSDIVNASALPATNKIVVLDAGHGKPDERCISF